MVRRLPFLLALCLLLPGGCADDSSGAVAPPESDSPSPEAKVPVKVVPDPAKVVEPAGECAGRVGGEGAVPGGPSEVFVQTCAGCHGPEGRGHGEIPGVLGPAEFPQFAAYVRAGVFASERATRSGRMPAFSKQRYPLELMRRDFAWVHQKPWAMDAGCQDPEEPVWSPRKDARAQMLEAWRTPDDLGAACADCHGPDPIDLATIAYRPGDVLRRAMLHVDSETAWAVVDGVGAMRQELGIRAVDPFEFRPLQPGQTLLEPAPGLPQAADDTERIDHAFGLALAARSPTLAGPPIREAEAADRAIKELMAIDPRHFPIGFALNRWTEDAHHGKDHQTFSDWITDFAQIPAPDKLSRVRALEDAYLAAPGWETLKPLIDAVDTDTQMVGGVPDPSEVGGRAVEMMRLKRQSVLIMQHLMRAEALGLPGLIGPTPLPDRNPVWNVGNMGRVHSVGNKADLKRCPPGSACQGYSEKLWGDDIAPGRSLGQELDALREPWFWAGWLIDFSTLRTDSSNSTKSTEYLTENLYQAGFYNHLTFLRFRKNLAATLGGGGWDPEAYGLDAARLASDRVNYHYFLGYGRGMGKKVPQDPAAKALYQRLLANAFRMVWVGMTAEVRRTGQAIGIVDTDAPQTAPDYGLRGKALAGADFFEDLHGLPPGSFAPGVAAGPQWSEDAREDLRLYQELQSALADPGVCDPTPPPYKQASYPGWCGSM